MYVIFSLLSQYLIIKIISFLLIYLKSMSGINSITKYKTPEKSNVITKIRLHYRQDVKMIPYQQRAVFDNYKFICRLCEQ